MKKTLVFSLSSLLLIYPFLVFFGIRNFSLNHLVLILGFLLLIRVFLLPKSSPFYKILFPVLIVSFLAVLLSFVLEESLYLRFYPVIVNGGLCLFFVFSLIFPPPIVERLARFKDPHLDERGQSYCRRVTQVWVLFFVLNGAMALYTVFESLETWTFYNGFLAYIFMGMLFAGEWIFRQYHQKKVSQ